MMDYKLLINADVESGGKEHDESDIENDFAYRNNVLNATKEIRLGFIRKVYGLLSMQLLLTTVVAGVCMYTPQLKEFVHTNDWMVFCSFIASFVLLIALHIKRRETPTNLILLAAFTAVEAYTIGVIVTFYETAIVIQALFLTLAVVAGLTLYTFQSKRDFSALYSVCFAGLFILLMATFLQILFPSKIMDLAISVGGAFLFSMFIVVDTNLMMNHMSPEEYILATITLYLDIINLFLYILRILNASRN